MVNLNPEIAKGKIFGDLCIGVLSEESKGLFWAFYLVIYFPLLDYFLFFIIDIEDVVLAECH